jgi:ribonuclease D
MNKTIYSKIDKKDIQELPIATFKGRTIVILTEQAAEKAVDYLLSADILGVDTETRPSFRKGHACQVALLQVSTRDTCFLFRLNIIGLCAPIIKLLENQEVPMVGLSWHDDLLMLHKRGKFVPGRFVELQDMVGAIGIKDLSLQKIWANLFSEKISKRQRLTNWEAPVLSDSQKKYAALDAWACIKVYEEIEKLKSTRNYKLVVVPELNTAEKERKTEKDEI